MLELKGRIAILSPIISLPPQILVITDIIRVSVTKRYVSHTKYLAVTLMRYTKDIKSKCCPLRIMYQTIVHITPV